MPTGKDPLFEMLRFYFPNPTSVLDVSFGLGSSWSGTDLESARFFGDKIFMDTRWPYETIKFDGYRNKDIDAQANWDWIPLKHNSVGITYWDPPFMYAGQSYTETRLTKGKYSERHVSHGYHALKVPAEEFARVSGQGLIVKIQDTRVNGQFESQHAHIILDAEDSGYWNLFDTRIFYYFRGKQPGNPGYALPVHDYYLIFKRTALHLDEWDDRLTAGAPDPLEMTKKDAELWRDRIYAKLEPDSYAFKETINKGTR